MVKTTGSCSSFTLSVQKCPTVAALASVSVEQPKGGVIAKAILVGKIPERETVAKPRIVSRLCAESTTLRERGVQLFQLLF